MKNIFTTPGLLLSGIMMLSANVVSASENHHHDKHEHHAEQNHRQHDAHEHGAAAMNIAIEDSQLHIELESPAINIVGFEHSPRSSQQKQTVQQAASALKNAGKMFELPSEAKCKLMEAEVESPLLKNDHDHHGHEEAHSEFHASYVFQCQEIKELKNIRILIFKQFSATHEIRVRLITSHGQTVSELNAQQNQINL